jgi:glycine hydroxymethyltransferase
MVYLEKIDPEIAEIIEKEKNRQINGLELIASENLASQAVLEAMGSILTNKYAEGYPGKRYYGGCEFHDLAENLARDRVCSLFGAEHANVQPHSGSQANMAVYFSIIKPGDKILSMNLSQGGHLSHGSPVNFSGIIYEAHQYGVDLKTEMMDYGQISEMAKKIKPKVIVCGASAYPREIDFKAFAEIANDVDAYCVADIAHIAGLCAAGIHPSPVGQATFTTSTTHKTLRGPRGGFVLCNKEWAQPLDKAVFPGMQGGPLMHIIAAKAVCFKEASTKEFVKYAKQVVKNAQVLAETLKGHGVRLVSGGTDNHLCLLDLTNFGLTGLEAEQALGRAGITVNKNTIPNETKSPFVTSGLRVGTPAVTSRGMKEGEMQMIGDWIAAVIKDIKNETLQAKICEDVKAMASQYPLYPDLV